MCSLAVAGRPWVNTRPERGDVGCSADAACQLRRLAWPGAGPRDPRLGTPAASARAASTSAMIARSEREATSGSDRALHVDVGAPAIAAPLGVEGHQGEHAVGADELSVAEGDHASVTGGHVTNGGMDLGAVG